MPPSKYLGLPWKPWGEVDFWLTQGLDNLDARICHCGSGLWREDCTDPANEENLHVVTEVHYGQAVLERWRKENGEPEPGTFAAVKFLSAEEAKQMEHDRAAAEIAAMKARHGLA